jgi:type IV pilus assembly protein PilN
VIRINLLTQERPQSKRPSFNVSEAGQKIAVGSTLILVVAALGVAWWYRSIQKDTQRLTEEVAAAEHETARLRTIIVQVQDFERRKAQLQQRVTLIEQLRKGQNGPVHMLDEISRSLPEMLWLTELKQTGDVVDIEGRCSVLTSLSDFVNSLEASGWFKRPVEIGGTQVERATGADVDLIRFTVKAQFAQPGG